MSIITISKRPSVPPLVLLISILFFFSACLEGQSQRLSLKNVDKYNHSTQTVKSVTSADQAAGKAEMPREHLDTAWIAPTGKTIRVKAGDDLQKALDGAQSGDEVVLAAGDTFTGNFILANKSGLGWITIRSSALDRLPPDKRVHPSNAPLMPKILSSNSQPAFQAKNRSSRWRLAGLEVSVTPQVTTNFTLIGLGSGLETTYDQLSSNFVLDRMYIHGAKACGCKRGIAMQGSRQAVIDSYISEIHAIGQDTQAVAGWNGPGPFKIVNNYLEAAGENIMFGGADPLLTFRMKVQAGATTTHAVFDELPPFSPGTPIMFVVGGKSGQHAYTVLRTINGNEAAYDALSSPPDANSMASTGVVPSDIEIRRNTIFKPLTWKMDDSSYAGTHWTVKNLFELKSAQRVLVEGNWMENSWPDAQTGGAVLMTSTNQEGSCPFCVTQDITFSNNVVKNIYMAIILVGHQEFGSKDASFEPATLRRIYIYNNLFYRSRRLFSFFRNASAVWIVNNTGFSNYNTVLIEPTEAPFPDYVFSGNILERSSYGFGGTSEGAAFLNKYFPHFQWSYNAIINSSEGKEGEQSNQTLKHNYPSNTKFFQGEDEVGFINLNLVGKDHHGYALAPDSPLKKGLAGGKDYGVDFTELDSKLFKTLF